MTQQVDPRSSAVHDQTAGFEFLSQGSGPGGNNTTSSSAPNNSNTSGGNDSGSPGDRWPSLLNVRQVVVAFVLETVSRSRPLQEKLNIVITRAWHLYLAYARAFPLATVGSFSSSACCLCFVSCLRIFIHAIKRSITWEHIHPCSLSFSTFLLHILTAHAPITLHNLLSLFIIRLSSPVW